MRKALFALIWFALFLFGFGIVLSALGSMLHAGDADAARAATQ